MGGAAAIVGGVLMIGGYVVYPLTYVAFCFFYSFYGAVLYVVGPIVISLLPAFGIGSLARGYIINLTIFHFWGVIYSVLGALIAAVNMGSVQQVLATGSFMGGFVGIEQSLLLGIASISSINCAISFGGKTRRQGPSLDLGQRIKVNSTLASLGRHFAGIWTRRFSSTP